MPAKWRPAGDLLITIEEQDDHFYYRDGYEHHSRLLINFADAALGTSIEVPTLDGRVKVKFTTAQAGKILRLKEHRDSFGAGYGRAIN